MKTYSLLFLALSSYCINGCEEASDSSENSQKITRTTKKSSVIQKPVKIEPKIKQLKISPKKSIKTHQLETNVNSKRNDQNQPPLDLSLPFEIEGTTSPSISEKKEYLPDLFTKNKNQIKNPLQIDGKIIKRDEDQADKDRAVDGVGIDFKLTH